MKLSWSSGVVACNNAEFRDISVLMLTSIESNKTLTFWDMVHFFLHLRMGEFDKLQVAWREFLLSGIYCNTYSIVMPEVFRLYVCTVHDCITVFCDQANSNDSAEAELFRFDLYS